MDLYFSEYFDVDVGELEKYGAQAQAMMTSAVRFNGRRGVRALSKGQVGMGWWLPEPDLEGGESILWRVTANWAQEARHQVGGTLVLTERRLLFTSGRFDASIGGRDWWAPRGAVTAVDEEPRSPGIHFGSAAAGNRRRLGIATGYGSRELFTVNQVRRRVAELRGMLALPADS